MTPQKPQHISAEQTVFFGIPLKARATAKNWDWTVRDFNRTLASVYNQTNPNFRILVGCHDIPDLLVSADDRLEFIQVHSPAPDLTKDPHAIYPDKARKLQRVGERFREVGGSWFMVLDADDLISNRLVDFVLSNPNPNGFIARAGYIVDEESRAVLSIPDPDIFNLTFDQICGSSAMVRFRPDDFKISSDPASQLRFTRYAGSADHRILWRQSIEDNRPLTPLPFAAVAYVLNTGNNHSMLHRSDGAWRTKRLIPSIRRKGSPDNLRFKKEFAFDHVAWKKEGQVPSKEIRSFGRASA
jgi:hypothetical protein